MVWSIWGLFGVFLLTTVAFSYIIVLINNFDLILKLYDFKASVNLNNMSELKQETIESFFEKYGVVDQEDKAKLLLEITDIIYNYNMSVVKAEKETDPYKKNQLLVSVEEYRAKIDEIFKDFLSKK